MTTIVAATNRPNAISKQIAQIYQNILQQKNAEISTQILSLDALPTDFLNTVLYQKEKPASFNALQEMVDNSQKFVFIIPEYNGSYPGALKVFTDALSFPRSFKGKKAALVGLSSGTQGAAMAMSHYADVLNYLGMHTLALRPRLININKNIADGQLTSTEYHSFLEVQAAELLDF
jgi:NAD(P)H-dependent FMN reductase